MKSIILGALFLVGLVFYFIILANYSEKPLNNSKKLLKDLVSYFIVFSIFPSILFFLIYLIVPDYGFENILNDLSPLPAWGGILIALTFVIHFFLRRSIKPTKNMFKITETTSHTNFIADDGMFINPMTIEEQLEMGLTNIDDFFKLVVEKIRSGLKAESIISLINLMPEIMTYRDFNDHNLLTYSILFKNKELELYLLENTPK